MRSSLLAVVTVSAALVGSAAAQKSEEGDVPAPEQTEADPIAAADREQNDDQAPELPPDSPRAEKRHGPLAVVDSLP